MRMATRDPGDGHEVDTHRGPLTESLDGAAGGDHALVRRFQLEVVSGPDAGTVFRSSGARAAVGTHASCDLVLTDPTVSRFHCDITPLDDRVIIRDLESRNGTLVDGLEIGSAQLRSGATIVVGRTQLRFGIGADHVKIPLSARERFGLMVGRSPAMRAVFSLLERAAESDATVLLEGETGTGKEVAAESLHREGKRRDRPFIVIDCGAIPPALLEAELFGHTKGAFTGAVADRRGAFEAASGGTIFLDEIGELGAELQPKLLRVLERREVKAVGTHEYRTVDVRVIAATHRNLRALVNEQAFRSDLFYRLAVLEVRLPPLRERREDLAPLVEHMLGRLDAPEAATAPLRTPEFLAELGRHRWPGNIRELRNYLERCLALGELPAIPAPAEASGEPVVDLSRPLKAAREAWLEPLERRYVEGLLERHGGNVTAAARAAGIDRVTFYRLMWRLGLREQK